MDLTSHLDRQRFLYLWNVWWQKAAGDATQGSRLGEEILALYQGNGRVYHNCTHPLNMWLNLDINLVLDPNLSLAINRNAIGLAIVGHDVIYDPLAQDNEERSAEYFGGKMVEGGIAEYMVDHVKKLILVTKHHQPESLDEALMVDLDLAILGLSPNRYHAYSQDIRQEYSMVNDEEFAAGRANFLQSMLGRAHIYHTDTFKDAYERQARENLEWELQRLIA